MIAENKTKLTQLNTETDAKLNDLEKTYDTSGNKIVSSFGNTLRTANTSGTIRQGTPLKATS